MRGTAPVSVSPLEVDIMQVAWGVVVIGLALLCWGGQAISWFAPSAAVRMGLMEAEDDVEPTFWADIRGEALWDVLTVWTMLVAGVLLVVDGGAWPYFGLAGGGMYVYFGGRGLLTRAAMLRRGLRVGSWESVRLGMAFLAVWGIAGLITIAAAVAHLEG